MDTRSNLLARISAFLNRTGLSGREFGLRAVNDHKFIPRLKAGHVTLGRIERAEAFMRDWSPATEQEAA